MPARRPLATAVLCFSVSCLTVAAQRVVVSQEVTLSDDNRYELFAGPDESVILYRDDAKGIELEAYGPEMTRLWQRELTLDRSRPNPLGALMHDGETVVFYTYRKDRGLYLKMHRYSGTGNLTDSLTVTRLEGDFLTGGYRLHYDEAGRYAVFTQQRDARTWVTLGVEVASGRLLYAETIDLTPSSSLYPDDVSEPWVGPRGGLYLWTQRDNRRSRLESHEVTVIRVSLTGAQERVTLPLPELLVFGLRLGVDEANDRVALAGYYANDPDEAAGVVTVALDYALTGEARVLKSAFSEALVSSVDPKDRRPEGIPDLTVLDVIFRRDGAALVVGEQRRATIRTVGGRGGTFGSTMKTDYLYEDIVLSVIGTEGGRGDWHEVLPKKQFSQDDGGAFSSYSRAVTPSALHLIYNDEVRSGGTVSEYALNGVGEIERHSIMNTEYQDLWLRHEAAVQLSGAEMVIPSERRNRLRLVRLSF